MDVLTASLIATGVAILGAIALIVRSLAPKVPGWIDRAVEAYLNRVGAGKTLEDMASGLEENTRITQEVRDASNGRLTAQINLNQDLQTENYALRRLIDALELDEAGQAALTDARRRLGLLRITRPAPPSQEVPRADC